MDSTRQEPVVETQQTIPRLKRRQWVRTEGHGGEGSRAVGGAEGQDGSRQHCSLIISTALGAVI